jgi:hypothetical protein
MITALLALSQASTPALPAGVSPEFSAQVYAIEQLLEGGQFDAASERLKTMPSTKIAISWDDAKVPADQKAEYAEARDQALRAWKTSTPDLSFEVAPNAPLKVSFSSTPLEKTADGFLKGMVLSFSRPTASAVIGLVRGNPAQASTAGNIQNDVFRAVGAYLGISDSPFASTAMTAIHFPSQKFAPMRQDIEVALQNLRALDALRTAAANRQTMKAGQPKLVIAGASDAGPLLQGERKRFQIQLKNEGNGVAQLWSRPDCGCITFTGTQSLAPGESKTIDANFDTTNFEGDFEKHIYFISNDPQSPLQTFTFRGNIRPMYRILAPSGPVAVVDGKEGSVELFLTFKDVEPFGIRQAGIQGLPGTVTFEPWEGVLADPQKGEGPVARKGYRILAKINGTVPPGRSGIGLVLQTNSPMHPIVQYTIYAQKGIVALPDQLNFGEVAGPKQAKFIVTRPGKAFKVSAVTSNSPNFKAAFVQTAPDEVMVEVAYDGKAPLGDLNGLLTIKTTDAKQPTVLVPIIGIAK